MRKVARLLTGTTYALLGYDAAREPGGRVAAAEPLLNTMRRFVPLPDDDQLLVRVNGGAQAAAGAALAVGVLPRTSAVVLIGSLIPTTLAGHAFWSIEDPAARKMQQVQFIKNMGLIGGLVYAAMDRSGR